MKHRPGFWQGVALSEEVSTGSAVVSAAEAFSLVLFRDESGIVRALEDRCAHRRAPLSLGRVIDGLIACPYHGWTYEGRGGRCVRIPNLSEGERVPSNYRVRAFETLEQDGFVWAWSGEGPGAEPPPLAERAGPRSWRGARRVVFSRDALIELALDAPSLVFDISGIVVADGRPLDEPVAEQDWLHAAFAADWVDLASERKREPADYPLSVSVSASLTSPVVRLALRDEANVVLAAATFALSALRPHLVSLLWRGSGGASQVEIGARAAIDADGLAEVRSYAGLMWRAAVATDRSLA